MTKCFMILCNSRKSQKHLTTEIWSYTVCNRLLSRCCNRLSLSNNTCYHGTQLLCELILFTVYVVYITVLHGKLIIVIMGLNYYYRILFHLATIAYSATSWDGLSLHRYHC